MEIETRRAHYATIGDFGLLVNREVADEYGSLKCSRIDDRQAIQFLRREWTDREIMANLSSCVSLVLGVTENCNFRCKYCNFSGQYPGERVHSRKKMDFDTAAGAVDAFLGLVMKDERSKKRRNIYIGFYGGEPLLTFDLIRNIVAYTETAFHNRKADRRFNILYRLTTNGYLLDNDVVDFLREKDMLVDISLDGPAGEHDKFRVLKDGGKTWARIMGNIENIRQRYPDYYDQRFHFLVTLHPHHDTAAVDTFFREHHRLFREDNVKFNSVVLDRLGEDERQTLLETIGTPSELQFSQICKDMDHKFRFKVRGPETPLTGTCFPGGNRIFVDTGGYYNICEKISHQAPRIGDVKNGFDFDSIRRIIKEYNEEIIRHRCWRCEHWFLCDVCLANSFKEGRFKIDCKIEESYAFLLKKYLEMKEDDEAKKYRSFDNHPTVVEFMERL
jgi:uncharacterized protein